MHSSQTDSVGLGFLHTKIMIKNFTENPAMVISTFNMMLNLVAAGWFLYQAYSNKQQYPHYEKEPGYLMAASGFTKNLFAVIIIDFMIRNMEMLQIGTTVAFYLYIALILLTTKTLHNTLFKWKVMYEVGWIQFLLQWLEVKESKEYLIDFIMLDKTDRIKKLVASKIINNGQDLGVFDYLVNIKVVESNGTTISE